MDLYKTLEEIGKFFNEILGYFLPGFTFNLMIYLTVDPKYFPLLKNEYLLNVWVVLVLSYIMGYFVYGITTWRDILLKNLYSNKFIIALLLMITNILKSLRLKKGNYTPKTVLESND